MATPWDVYPTPNNPEAGLSTPSNYATQEQVKQQRGLAQMLMGHGKEGAQQDVHHWTQGLSNLANTLVGNMLQNQALHGENEQLERAAQAYDLSRAGGPGGGVAPPQSHGPFEGSYGEKLFHGLFGGGDDTKSAPSNAVAAASSGEQPLPRMMSAPPQLKQAWGQIEQQYGLPPGYLEQTAGIESSFNPRSHNEFSGADGYFQFIPGTARQYGLRYGTDTRDPVASAHGAARYAADNAKALAAAGIPVTAGNLYLAHQQGTAGAIALLRNPTAPAGAVVPAQNIAANGGNPRAPAAAFIQHWAGRFPATEATAPTGGPAPPAGIAAQNAARAPGASKLDANGNEIPDRIAPAQPPQNAPAPAAGAPGATRVASTDPTAGVSAMDRSLPAAQAMAANRLGGGAIVGAPPAPNEQVAASRANPGGGQVPGPNVAPRGGVMQGAQPPVGAPVPPQLLPQRFRISPEQLHEAIRNPYVPWEQKQKMLEDYRLQFQPVQGVNQYNQPVISSPVPGGPQMTIQAPQEVEVKSGESSAKIPFTWQTQPDGSLKQVPIPGMMYQEGGGAPGGVLGGPAGGGRTATPPPDVPSIGPPPGAGKRSEAAPAATPGAVPEAGQAPNQAPVRVASLDTGTMNDASGGGPLSTPPPAAAKAPDETKVAQSGGGFQIPQPLDALSNYNIQQKVKEDAAKKFQDADITKEADSFDSNQKAYQTALTLRPQLLEQKALVEDPRLKQGPGYEFKMVPDVVRSFFGSKEANDALAANSAFSKNVAGTILGTMKSYLEGLGQVRVKEMELLDTASASPHNTLAANRLIIDMASRYQEQMIQLGKIANAYHQGWRPDDKGNWTVKTNERPTNAGLNEVITRYRENNPIYKDEELTGLLDRFKEYDKKGEEEAKKSAGAGPALGSKPPPVFTKEEAAQEAARRKANSKPKESPPANEIPL